MSYFLRQSTARNLMILMVDATDHITGLAGLTLTITASKDGGAFSAISPTVTDRGSGWYSLALTSGHTDTLGDLALHVTGAGADPVDVRLEVLAGSHVATLAADSVTSSVIADNAIDAGAIASGAITSAKFAAGAIDAAAVADGAIDAAAIATGAITAAKFAAGAIDAAAIASNAITSAKIAADAIGSAQLAASAVTEIAAGVTVPTAADIADAVLDESLLDHLTLDSVGGALANAVGLSQGNQMIDNITHASGKMTACRLRLFDTNASLAGATPDTGGGYESGEIARYEMTATYSGDNLSSYEVARVDPS